MPWKMTRGIFTPFLPPSEMQEQRQERNTQMVIVTVLSLPRLLQSFEPCLVLLPADKFCSLSAWEEPEKAAGVPAQPCFEGAGSASTHGCTETTLKRR